MARMANGGFLHAALEETQYLIKKPCAEVWEEKKWGVEFPSAKMVKTAIERHLAMPCQNHIAHCLPCHNGTAENPVTLLRRNGTGVPSLNRHRQPSPDPMPPLPGTPSAATGNTSGVQCSHIVNLPARYSYLHISLRCAECFTLNASAQDSQNDTDFDPEMLTNEGIATG
jgi:hypothetical protein